MIMLGGESVYVGRRLDSYDMAEETWARIMIGQARRSSGLKLKLNVTHWIALAISCSIKRDRFHQA